MRRLLPLLISFVFFASFSASASSVVNDGYVLLDKDELEQIFDPAVLYVFAAGNLPKKAAQASYHRHCDEIPLSIRPGEPAHQRLQESLRAYLNNSGVHIVATETIIYDFNFARIGTTCTCTNPHCSEKLRGGEYAKAPLSYHQDRFICGNCAEIASITRPCEFSCNQSEYWDLLMFVALDSNVGTKQRIARCPKAAMAFKGLPQWEPTDASQVEVISESDERAMTGYLIDQYHRGNDHVIVHGNSGYRVPQSEIESARRRTMVLRIKTDRHAPAPVATPERAATPALSRAAKLALIMALLGDQPTIEFALNPR